MSSDPKKPKPGYSPASINREAVFWLNSSPETRERITMAGGCPPTITGDDHFVAAQQRNEEIASPKLGNDAKRARDLLSLGADISHDFNAAVQNAARGGHLSVLKLAMVADENILAARNDAYASALKGGQPAVRELLDGINEAGESEQRKLRKEFLYSVGIGRPKDAAIVLDKMVALMFPKAPKIN